MITAAHERPWLPAGLMAVLATVIMLFAAFTAAYVVRRSGADWVPVPLPDTLWVAVGILVAGDLAAEAARRSARRGELDRTLAALRGLGLFGLLFLALQTRSAAELWNLGVFLPTSPHASFLYMLAAVHALHVIGGLACCAWVMGRYAARRTHEVVGACAAYWHTLTAVWIAVLLVLRAG